MNEIEVKDVLESWIKTVKPKDDFEKEASKIIISALEKQLTNGWIPINYSDDDSYPKSFESVQFTDGEDFYIGCCDPNSEWTSTNGEDSIQVYDVLAWQPLPEKYKEKLNEE